MAISLMGFSIKIIEGWGFKGDRKFFVSFLFVEEFV
jgi:hypothetical protein